MELDQTVMDEAWKLYMSEGRKGMNQIAKAIAKKHSMPQGEVHEYLISQINSSRRRARWTIAGTVGAVITGMLLTYLVGGKAKPTLELVEKPIPVQSVEKPASAKEAEQPEEKRQKLNLEALAGVSGVERVVDHHGEKFDVIYILNDHPHMFVPQNWDSSQMAHFESACLELYDKYDVKDALFEGISHRLIIQFLKEGRYSINPDNHKNNKEYHRKLMGVLNKREWRTGSAETTEYSRMLSEYIGAAKKIHNLYIEKFYTHAESLLNEMAIRGGKEIRFPKPLKEILEDDLNQRQLQDEIDIEKRLDEIIPPADHLFRMMVTARDKSYARLAKQMNDKGKGTVIVYLGTGHMATFTEEMAKQRLNYAVVKLKGGSEPGLECSPENLRQFFVTADFTIRDFDGEINFGSKRITIERE